jgi:hypothetical protein
MMMVQLICGDQWISLGNVNKRSPLTPEGKSVCVASKERLSAISFIISVRTFRAIGNEVYLGLDATAKFRKFEQIVRSKHLFSLSRGAAEKELRSIFTCLDQLSEFLRESDTSQLTSSDLLEVLDPVGDLTIPIRQAILREQCVLGCLIDLIELCALGIFRELIDNTLCADLIACTKSSMDEHLFTQPSEVTNFASDVNSLRHSIMRHSTKRFGHQDSLTGRPITQQHSWMSNKTKSSRSSLADARVSSTVSAQKKGGTFLSHSSKHDIHHIPETDRNLMSNQSKSLTQELVRSCLSVLYLGLVNNHQNQISVANSFLLLLSLVSVFSIIGE